VNATGSRGAAGDADEGGEMKLNIKIEYDAEREEGESADDESRILGVVGEELESYVASILSRAQAEGIVVNMTRS